MAGDGGTRLGWAFVLACPTCAGGVFLAVGSALGVTAVVFKSALLVAAGLLLAALWGANAWRRRGETASCAPGPG